MMTPLEKKADRLRRGEVRAAHQEIALAERRLPEWAVRSPDLLDRIREDPKLLSAAISALRAHSEDTNIPKADRELASTLAADLADL